MKKYILLAVLLFSHVVVQAQTNCRQLASNSNCDVGWFTLAFGGDSEFDFNASLSANFGRNDFWRVSFTSRGSILGGPNIGSIDFMKGLSTVDRIGRASFSAGVSLLSFQEYNYDDQTIFKPGISFHAESIFTPIKELGTGIDLMYTMAYGYQSLGIRFVLAIEGHK